MTSYDDIPNDEMVIVHRGYRQDAEETFDANKLNKISGRSLDGDSSQSLNNYYQFSDNYANKQFMRVSFKSMITGQYANFKAFITAFNETYVSDWSEEQLYGRMDPVVLFKHTQRRITLGLKIPAASVSEGYENLGKVSELIKMLYPSYRNVNQATTITQSPLVRMRVMNLAIAAANAHEYTSTKLPYGEYHRVGSPEQAGLLGAIVNVSVNHNLENPDAGVLEMAPGVVLPKLIELSIDFVAIHEHSLGWQVTGNDAAFGPDLGDGMDGGGFPYGIDLATSLDPSEPETPPQPGAAIAEEDPSTTDPNLVERIMGLDLGTTRFGDGMSAESQAQGLKTMQEVLVPLYYRGEGWSTRLAWLQTGRAASGTDAALRGSSAASDQINPSISETALGGAAEDFSGRLYTHGSDWLNY